MRSIIDIAQSGTGKMGRAKRDTKLQGHKATRPQGYQATRLQGYKATPQHKLLELHSLETSIWYVRCTMQMVAAAVVLLPLFCCCVCTCVCVCVCVCKSTLATPIKAVQQAPECGVPSQRRNAQARSAATPSKREQHSQRGPCGTSGGEPQPCASPMSGSPTGSSSQAP